MAGALGIERAALFQRMFRARRALAAAPPGPDRAALAALLRDYAAAVAPAPAPAPPARVRPAPANPANPAKPARVRPARKQGRAHPNAWTADEEATLRRAALENWKPARPNTERGGTWSTIVCPLSAQPLRR